MQASEQSKVEDIDQKMAAARQKTWEAIDKIASQIEPGMTESEAIKLAQKTLAQMGSRKFWHRCHIRFGQGTIHNWDDPYVDNRLGENDIFYIDIGPVWSGIEGDGGKTFVVGSDERMAKIAGDAKIVYDNVKAVWLKDGVQGKELYRIAEEEAAKLGWKLAPSYVRGHRLSEFPHSFHSELHVDQLDFCPAPKRWVLEIHICDPQFKFGAFYEDLL
jgi:methionine aminopeptidase